MQIQINTDHHLSGHDAVAARIGGVVENALNRLSNHITRVEVHLGDVNGAKSGQDDKRCVMEARLQGRKPVTVTHHAATMVRRTSFIFSTTGAWLQSGTVAG